MTLGWKMCSYNLQPSVIRFASLLSYVPERRWRDRPLTEEQRNVFKMGREYMLALKRDSNQPNGLLPICDSVAKWCADNKKLFSGFFSTKTILVPVPGSTLTRPDTLWVPKILADALVEYGLGGATATCLSRVKPIPKSATSRPEDRAAPIQHYETMGARRMLTEPKNILLVDDLVTRGSTFLGAAWRIAALYPNSRIKAFAAMRTVSDGNRFVGIMDPRKGKIFTDDNGRPQRRP